MSKGRVLFSIVFVGLLVMALVIACGGQEPTQAPPAPPTVGGAELLQGRCTQCHTLDRVEAANKTQAEWEATVERMRGKGANLTDDEAQTLVEYLTETYGP
jgi:cytochrome c5